MKNIFSKVKKFFDSSKKKVSRPKKLPISTEWVLGTVLILISVILCFKSYTPNTFLTGWDTLHPEFNLSHAIQSVVWGVWRSDQGLGAVAIHSHMGELPRIIYLLLVSKVLSLNFLRYSFFFLTLLLAPVSMFIFLNNTLKGKHPWAAFVGASYYLLNLGTVSRYSVPFEMFATQFAFLPWAFLLAFKYLDTHKKKYLILLGVASFLSSSQAYAATLFYAFFAIYSLSLLCYSFLLKNKKSIKNVVVVLLTVLIANAYWILPNIYSIRNQSLEVSNSKINELFTPEATLHNQSFGSLIDVISQKSYLFDWQAYNFDSNTFVKLLENWNQHLANRNIFAIALVFATLSFLGILVALFSKEKKGISLVLPLLVTIFFLMNENGPLSFLYDFIRNNSGLFSEGFRDPFTKFSILFSFFASFFVFEFLVFLYKKHASFKFLSVLLVGSLILLFKPAFTQGIVSPLMRKNIPQEYFEMNNWLNGKEGRVMQLPLNTLWGWQYNDWGYQGAGFAWFGQSNSYLTRDFDRWSSQNETFYSEASNAYFNNDLGLFEEVIRKYNIKYLVLDGSIVDPQNGGVQHLGSEYEKFLSTSKFIKKVTDFGFISIYETGVEDRSVTLPENYSVINSNSTYAKVDYTYSQFGNYVSGSDGILRPFNNFDDRVLTINQKDDWGSVNATFIAPSDSSITIPDIVKRESVLPVTVSISRNEKKITVRFDLIKPTVSLDDKEIKDYPSYMLYDFPVTKNAGKLGVEDAIFDFSNLPLDGAFYEVGKTYVTTKGNTNIYVFSDKKTPYNSFLTSITKKKAVYCSDPSKEAEIMPHTNGFSINITDNSLCIGDGINLPVSSLFETTFETPNGDSSFFCINQAGKDGCLNVLPPTAGSVFGGRKVTYETPLTAGAYWFAFVGQTLGEGTQSVATFDNISLSYYPVLSKASLNFGDGFSLFSFERNVAINNAHEVTISFPIVPLVTEDFKLRRGHTKAVNCETNLMGSVSKQFDLESVTYDANDDGVSCDYFDYPQLLQSQPYLMTISGVNKEGRSLKFYLQNQATNHMDMEELLPSGNFDKSYVLEGDGKGIGGYVLNFETRAFNSIASENTINKISFSPIPVRFLTEISIGKSGEVTKNNNLDMKSSWRYSLISKYDSSGNGIFGNNQAYEKGWIAIDQNLHILSHTKLNGWENAWVIEDGTTTVYIFYLPQLLEFFGFLLIVLGIVTLIKK